ncbi:ankyrin repeat domain-containing protein [Bdellovibrio bacteriovorus]|uniref:ankyrin repeat domain-containing protein n=1 Tax=Bdellovibrio bacteriovorus TaxID=959 RepID=UPI0021CEF6BD|nr:ankyrin repeat domain-containing protein [Bdellovibrio bacteriovorus]UXR65998.1 ankyrin repeat domain-containing protein [Bdellovibrio bacteriovorus]
MSISSPETQLLEATENHDSAKVRSLLKQKIKIDEKDSHGRTALLIATRNNDVEIARLLIEAGADVNVQDQIQDSPLLYAGANVNIPDRDKVTALTHAKKKGFKEIVAILEKAGAK